MVLDFITKRNFCLDKTRKIRPHQNNLRFHFNTINMPEKLEILSDLCTKFDKYSREERKDHLIRYLSPVEKSPPVKKKSTEFRTVIKG